MSKAGGLGLAAAFALAPIVGSIGSAALAGQPAGFAMPDRPLVLTRQLRRALPGGKEIVVRRSYRVRFSREPDGFRVDGELIGVEVDAPAVLKPLADLERTRPDSGLFPLHLDAAGRIVSQSGAADLAMAAQGAAVISARVDSSALGSSERGEARGFVAQVAQSGAGTAWPADIFHPEPGNRSEIRKVALSGGEEGEVSISTEASVDRANGWLATFDRTVTTRLNGSMRESRETWTLGDSATGLAAPIP